MHNCIIRGSSRGFGFLQLLIVIIALLVFLGHPSWASPPALSATTQEVVDHGSMPFGEKSCAFNANPSQFRVFRLLYYWLDRPAAPPNCVAKFDYGARSLDSVFITIRHDQYMRERQRSFFRLHVDPRSTDDATHSVG